jgi:hypothetical protein
MDEILSLAYYITYATRRADAPIGFNFLRQAENFIAALMPFEAATQDYYDDDLVALINIHIARDEFLDVLAQIERGVRPRNVSLPVRGVAPNPQERPSFFENYINNIHDDRTKSSVCQTINRLNEVMHGISYNGVDENGNPVVEANNPKSRPNGLVVGRVQSGKTRNYIGLMLKAFDEGWNTIFVLTSNSTELRTQTASRIAKDFAKAGITDRYARQIDVSIRNGNLPANDTNVFLYWGVVIKEVNNIGNFKQWLNDSRAVHQNMRVMIIDDEADNASPNSNNDPNLLEDAEIDLELEKLACLAEDEQYAGLVDVVEWFQNLRTLNAEHAALSFARDILAEGAKSATVQRDALLRNQEWCHLTGATEEIVREIYNYYNKGNRKPNVKEFILLVKSILSIATDRSQINGGIIEIVDKTRDAVEYTYNFKHCAYIAYTATPYACILNENPNATSIYPDFIQSLDKSNQYFGLAEIFGRYDPDNLNSRMPILQTFSDEEAVLVDKVKSGARISDDLSVEGDEWVGLKDAISYFVCSAAARRVRRKRDVPDIENNGNEEFYSSIRDDLWTSMLVNIHHTIGVMDGAKDAIKTYLRHFLRRDDFIDVCHEAWVRMTGEFTEEYFRQLFPNYGEFEPYPSWEALLPQLEYFRGVDKIQVVVLNTGISGREDSNRYANNGDGVQRYTDDRAWIVCGGNKISRGLTLPGLTVSYFDRLNKTIPVDTMTQMGRWFGYRRGYEMLPRIWMKPANLQELKKIAQVEELLHPSIRENFDNHYSPADPNHFQTVYSFGRKLSGREQSRRRMDAPMGALIHSKALPIQSDSVVAAYNIVNRFATEHQEKVRNPEEYQYNKIPLWENVPVEDVVRTLTELRDFYPEKTKRVLNALIRDINSSLINEWDVVLGTPVNGVLDHEPEGRNCFRIGGFILSGGRPQIFHKDGVLEAESRLHISFYANFPTTVLDETTEYYRDYFRRHPENVPQNKDLPEGFRNRSDSRYMSKAFASLRSPSNKKPVLQFYVINPQGNVEGLEAGIPLIAISVYWPEHNPDYFVANEVGYEPPPRSIDKTHVFVKVNRILQEANFPMTTAALRAKFLEFYPLRKFPNAETVYNANVRRGNENGYGYYQFPGKDAYASINWAEMENAEAKIACAFLEKIAMILRGTTNQLSIDELKNAVLAADARWNENLMPSTPAELQRLIGNHPEYNLKCAPGRPYRFWFNREGM